MWLRDYLPLDLERQGLSVRILIYGYDSNLVGTLSNASIHDYGKQFLEALKVARSSESVSIFIVVSDR
jgi:hypothetical protein